jgi:hypothetical protein
LRQQLVQQDRATPLYCSGFQLIRTIVGPLDPKNTIPPYDVEARLRTVRYLLLRHVLTTLFRTFAATAKRSREHEFAKHPVVAGESFSSNEK